MGLARALTRLTAEPPPGILVNQATGEVRPQGANRPGGFTDWPGLIEYQQLDFSGPQVSEAQAVGLPGVGRAVRLLCAVVSGLTPYRVRNAEAVTRPTEVLDPTPLMENPDPSWHGRSAWLSAMMWDLVLYGNGFADRRTTDRNGFPLTLPLIPAQSVTWATPRDGGPPVYAVGEAAGRKLELDPWDVFHAVVNPRAGKRMGQGILDMYQSELRLMLVVEKAQYVVMRKGRPVGVLSVDTDMTVEELREQKAAFIEGMSADGIAALIKATFGPVSWNANDLALIPAREFNLRLASDITGVPPYLLGVPAESRVYSNMETEWSNFLRVSVDQYLRAIQDPWSACQPRGTVVRFDVDELRRPEEKTRWETYALAVGMGAMTVPEVRQAERMGPMIGEPTPDAVEVVS